MSVEQDVVCGGDVTHPAVCSHRAPPRRATPRAGGEVVAGSSRGTIRGKAASSVRARHRHDSAV
ncbi:MAG: hypothetical protein WCF33_05245 [Pseudonocardiaceae bacterium]